MKPSSTFLPLKYGFLPSLPKFINCSATRKKIGWNLRKSINWNAVHNAPNDKEALIRAGDQLVDNDTVPIADLRVIYPILVNRSKYNKASGTLDRKLKIRPEWNTFTVQYDVGQEFPDSISEMVYSSEMSSIEMKTLWFSQILHNLCSNIEYVDCSHKPSNLVEAQQFFLKFLETFSCNKQLITEKKPLALILNICDALGLDDFNLDSKISELEVSNNSSKTLVTENQEGMLIEVNSFKGRKIVSLNTEHSFYKSLSEKSSVETFKSFIPLLLNSLEEINFNENQLDDLLFLLDLKSKRAAR